MESVPLRASALGRELSEIPNARDGSHECLEGPSHRQARRGQGSKSQGSRDYIHRTYLGGREGERKVEAFDTGPSEAIRSSQRHAFIAIRRVERRFALFSKEIEDLVLIGTASWAVNLRFMAGKPADELTNPPNMTSQVQEFFIGDISEPEAVHRNRGDCDKPMCSPSYTFFTSARRTATSSFATVISLRALRSFSTDSIRFRWVETCSLYEMGVVERWKPPAFVTVAWSSSTLA